MIDFVQDILGLVIFLVIVAAIIVRISPDDNKARKFIIAVVVAIGAAYGYVTDFLGGLF